MEIDKLEDNLNELSVELTALKHITDGLDKYGDQQIYHWLKDVERIAGDNDEMQARLDTLRRPYASNNHNGSVELDEILIKELNVKVIESLEVVHSLKEQAFETFLLQITEDKLKRYSHDDLIMFTSEFSHKIGCGGFSNVYSGRLSDGVQVAAKVLKQNHYIPKDVIRDIFVTEVTTMIKTSHPNLIKLYGFCFDDNMKALVYEYMENGSLDKLLFKKHIVVEWRRLYEIAIDIAKVLAYLHHDCDDQIIHHDIKPANILLDSNFSPKVTDFGVAKIMNRDVTHFTMTRTRGTSSYIAPEMTMQASRVTYTCDVYSFGMTLFDILGMRVNTQTQPSFPTEVWRKFEKGKLDEIINECGIWEEDAESARILSLVALWCIQFTLEIRPSMKDVVNVLEKNLQVARPPNPFLAQDKLLSIRQSQDKTNSTVTTFTHQSVDVPQNLDFVEEEESLQGGNESTYSIESLRRDRYSYDKDNVTKFSYNELREFSSDFKNKIGSGSYGDVFKGQFSNGMEVAIKVQKDEDNEDLNETFWAEIKTRLNTGHQNLLKLIGFCRERKMKALVYEYMEMGSLDKILYNEPLCIEWEKLYGIAIDIGKTLAYLHHHRTPPVIHFAVKPSMVLIDSDHSPKLTGFGLSVEITERTSLTISRMKKTPVFAAPELWQEDSNISIKCDVFCFGMLLFEILGTAKNKQNTKYFPGYVWKKFENGKLNDVIVECDFKEKDRKKAKILSMVALWCIQYTPETRPTMITVVTVLEKEIAVNKPPNPFQPSKFSESMQPEQSSSEALSPVITERMSNKDHKSSTRSIKSMIEIFEKRFWGPQGTSRTLYGFQNMFGKSLRMENYTMS